jgi:cobalt-zinc-cadmium efflux system outer membrane protein
MHSRKTALNLPAKIIVALLITSGFAPCRAFGGQSPVPAADRADGAPDLEILPIDATAKENLNGLIQASLELNPEIRAQEENLASAGGLQLQASLHPNPRLDVEVSTDFERPSIADRGFAVGYSHLFETGGKRKERIAVADRQIRISQFQLSESKRNLISRLCALFLQVLAVDREIDTHEKLLDVVAGLEAIVGERVRVGEDPAIALAQAKVERNRLAAELGLLRSRRRALLTEMEEVIGLPPGSAPSVTGEITIREISASLEGLVAHALESRPDLHAARSEQERIQAEVSLLKAESVPDVEGVVRYSYSRSAFDLYGLTSAGQPMPIQDCSHGISLGLNFELSVRDRNQGSIVAAAARSRSQKFRVSSMEASIRREVETAFERYRSTRVTLHSLEIGVLEQALGTLETLRTAYRFGELPFSEVLNEQRRLIDLENTYNGVIRDYVLAAVDLADASSVLIP